MDIHIMKADPKKLNGNTGTKGWNKIEHFYLPLPTIDSGVNALSSPRLKICCIIHQEQFQFGTFRECFLYSGIFKMAKIVAVVVSGGLYLKVLRRTTPISASVSARAGD
jgi:hypothetical protein